jgi:hypothetical protein
MLPSDLTPDTYYVGAIADYANAISETSDSNNNWNVTQINVWDMLG